MITGLATDLLQRLHELARHGADVGTTMALDLGFVAHAADAEAEELAAERIGDRMPDGSLADAGRPDQQHDRALPSRPSACRPRGTR
jgi:hypothetical protein